MDPKSWGSNGSSDAVLETRFSVKPQVSFVRQPRSFQQVRQCALLISGQTVLLKGMYHDRTHQLVPTVSVGSVIFDFFAAAKFVRRDRLKSVRRDVLGVRTRPQILTAGFVFVVSWSCALVVRVMRWRVPRRSWGAALRRIAPGVPQFRSRVPRRP